MTELLLLALGASLVNNFVLTHFLGLCPFVGVSRRFEAAAGMALATLFVLTLASGLSHALWQWVLQPLGLEYLRTLGFILLIAGVVQFTELIVRATSPLLHQALGIFLPLITTNCAVLGVALLTPQAIEGGLGQLLEIGEGRRLGAVPEQLGLARGRRGLVDAAGLHQRRQRLGDGHARF